MQKRRVLQLFYTLAKTPDTYYRSLDLANIVNVSDRTIKSDIKELEDFAIGSGFKVVSQKGRGYKLIITDGEVFHNVFEQIEYFLFSYENNPKKLENRAFDILRTIIVEDDYLTVDDIADKMYLSKSSISTDMNEVYKILADYDLTLKKKSESGSFVKGSELNKRLLMLYLYENSFHDALPLYINDDFAALFAYDDNKRREVRHVFLHELRNTITIVESIAPILSRYLCLLTNRYKSGCFVSFDDNEILLIKKLKEYEIAKKIFVALKDYDGFDTDINEVYAFAVLLASYADVLSRDDIARSDIFDNEINEIIDRLFEKIDKSYHINFNNVASSRDILRLTLYPIVIQKHFGISSCNIYNSSYLLSKSVFPISTLFALSANTIFNDLFDCELCDFNVYLISVAIQRILFSISYEIKPVNAMVISGYGINAACVIRDIIRGRYSALFNKLDCYELYEPREIPLSDYDWVIGNIPDFSYRYEWPLFITDAIPNQRQINGIYNEVCLSGVDFDNIVCNLHYEAIDLFEDYELAGLNAFNQIISYKLGKDMQSIKNIFNSLDNSKRTLVVGETMIVFIDRKDVKKSVFEIYVLKNKCSYNYFNVRTIIVLTLDAHDSLQTIRFMNDCLYMMCIKTSDCIQIIKDENLNGLSTIVKVVLKALPISLDQGKNY